jgi:hypothetical protein
VRSLLISRKVPLNNIAPATAERLRRMATFEEMVFTVAPSLPAEKAHHNMASAGNNSGERKRKKGSIRGQAWVQLAFKQQKMENDMSTCNLWMFVFAMLGLALAIAANEFCFDLRSLTYPSTCVMGDYLKIGSASCLFLMDCLLVYYYHLHSRAKMIRWFYASPCQV